MGKQKAPPPPDYSGVARASEASAAYSFQLGKEQLAWAKEQYASDREISQQVINDAMRRQDETDSQARRDRERYERIFQPLEEDLVSDAKSYTDQRNRSRGEAAAGRAAQDVASQFAVARTAAQDRLESFGIDPSQVRAGALDVSSRIAEATARAGAANQTREGVVRAEEATGRALRSEALNVGKGYPGQIAQSYGVAMQSGNQAANTGLATTASGANTMGTGVQWQGQGNQALNQWGSLLANQDRNNIARYEARQKSSSGVGSVLGLVGGLGMKMATGGLFEEGGAVEPAIQGVPVAQHPGGPHMGVPVGPQTSPSQGVDIDDVPARLNVGEFVVPTDTVKWLGEMHFQNLIEKSRKEKSEAKAKPKLAAVPVSQRVMVDTDRAVPV